MKTVNGKIAVEPYTLESLQAEVKSGYAVMRQAVRVIPLKVVFSTEIDGTEVKSGSLVYFQERTLNEQAWAKTPLRANVGGKEYEFILADTSTIVGVAE